MEADRLFAVETSARGLDGWMDAYASDAVRLRLGGIAVQGLDAVRTADAPLFADPARRLLWEPTDAGVFADGLHGFTTGTSAFVTVEDGVVADTLSTGRYVTFWRRDEDGTWKVILDTGVTDPAPRP
jgi:ketosteroid isomerase-like protein